MSAALGAAANRSGKCTPYTPLTLRLTQTRRLFFKADSLTPSSQLVVEVMDHDLGVKHDFLGLVGAAQLQRKRGRAWVLHSCNRGGHCASRLVVILCAIGPRALR